MPLLILGGIVLLGLLFYFFSVRSRKSYRCPKCGETITYVEHMKAERCGMCGAPLDLTKENY